MHAAHALSFADDPRTGGLGDVRLFCGGPDVDDEDDLDEEDEEELR